MIPNQNRRRSRRAGFTRTRGGDPERNAVFIAEHRDYRFDEKTIKTDDPRVVKEEDHTCDTLKYFAIDNAQLLGLLV